jgi:hypothetical protein
MVDDGEEQRALERAWRLSPDASELERLLALRPKTPAGWRHRNARIAQLCREQGLTLPWADHTWTPSQDST